mmetsp:Transcript_102221/g.266649  ORF Transcript_102221/g.266649 Transcript_102221/m.266649 type:complete len:215 (-) Transcript_102221:1148-1792(-)
MKQGSMNALLRMLRLRIWPAKLLPAHECLLQIRIADVVDDAGFADAHGQREVLTHGVLHSVRDCFHEELVGHYWAPDRHLTPAQHFQRSVPLLNGDEAELLRKNGHVGHVASHRLAMHELVLRAQGRHLQVLADTMAEIDEPLQGMLPKIRRELLQHFLDGKTQHPCRGSIDIGTGHELVSREARAMLFQEAEEFLGLHDRHLGHLRDTIRHVS